MYGHLPLTWHALSLSKIPHCDGYLKKKNTSSSSSSTLTDQRGKIAIMAWRKAKMFKSSVSPFQNMGTSGISFLLSCDFKQPSLWPYILQALATWFFKSSDSKSSNSFFRGKKPISKNFLARCDLIQCCQCCHGEKFFLFFNHEYSSQFTCISTNFLRF